MEPLVTTVQGKLEGTTCVDSSGEKYYKFQGIPYARPPVGLLRFKAPEPPEEWIGVLDATKEGNSCYSRHPFNNKIVGSEDCLYLNVYTKKVASSNENNSLFPVLFWIHGGAFLNGSGGTEMYGPDFLITQNVVVVTINYRLGILGFLSLDTPELKVPGNAGLKDIVMALKWVQTNIQNFGGDPKNVTVFGQSAGGVAVHLLLLSQMSHGLFHKAIAQSGCAFSPWARGTTGIKELASILHLEENEEKIYELLLKLPVDELFKLQEKIVSFLNIYASKQRAFAYVVEKNSDGFLCEEPFDIISSGKFQQLPFMIGYTTAETWGFDSLRPDDWPGAKNMEDSIPWTLGFKTGSPESQVMAEKIKKFYSGGHIPTTIKLETKIAIHTDANFVFGVYKTVLNHFNKSKAPTYLYRFSAETELNVMRQNYKIKIPGVVHCDDIGYLFKNVSSPRIKSGSREDILLKKVVKLWTNFAKFGNPTPDDELSVTWKPVTDKEVDYLDIGDNLISATNSVEHKRIKFLTHLYERKNSSSHFEISTLAALSIEQGKLRGSIGTDIRGNNFFKFKGIPYAKPPLGGLRFKAPQPPEKWTGVLDASKEGDACYHCDVVRENMIVGSENCLVLNVYTHQLSDGKNFRPVMVWIHGGGFVWGSGSEELYGPNFLMTESIVYVTINYRLGMLGFLNLEDPSLEVPGNAGFKDMIMGLKWVQKNISAFGGDPNNVTIFGESAGGASVHLLTLSPLAKGLFHKTIVQSASALNPWARGTKGASLIAKVLNLEGADDKTILDHLRTKTVAEILEIQKKIVDPLVASEIRPFGPVVESGDSKTAFLAQEPFQIILSGNFIQVPLMIGFTSREGMLAQLFKDCRKEFSVHDYIPWFFGYSKEETKALSATIKNFYFGNEEPSAKNVIKAFDLVTDIIFLYGIYKTVTTQYSRSKAPIYMYQMSIETKLNFFKNLLKIQEPGVCHADDIGYLFNHFVTPKITPGSVEDIGLSRFVKLWTNFAKFGNPTPDQNDQLLQVVWKPITNPEIHFLDIGNELKMMSDPYSKRIQFWEKLYSESPAGKRK
ncbi:uncharacterized protein LOC123004101 [Tribolium madens]|uniref:uncharacterized protein LOC123004101 n=1 Tax=Tribolium madens TaxID=41895 RepID=UPI001CF76512|nr:uncharacterized protein LOC123004101 [Tribolium madens]